MSDPTFPTSPAFAGPEDKTMTVVVYGLYLLGFVSGGATTLIGLVMAYMLRSGARPWAYSHYEFLIRTFWAFIGWMLLAGLIFAVGLALSVVLIGIPMLVVAAIVPTVALIWYAVRCIVGLVAALQNQPYNRPRAWIV